MEMMRQLEEEQQQQGPGSSQERPGVEAQVGVTAGLVCRQAGGGAMAHGGIWASCTLPDAATPSTQCPVYLRSQWATMRGASSMPDMCLRFTDLQSNIS
jgi:hypothetical protein